MTWIERQRREALERKRARETPLAIDRFVNKFLKEEKMTTDLEVFKGEVTKMKPEFGLVLPEGVSPDRFVRILQSAITLTPTLANVNRKKFFRAAMSAAQDGLLPDGKESAIVQMGGEVVYMPMVGGIIKRIYATGKIKSIACEIVYENDAFSYEVNQGGAILTHRPVLFGKRGGMIGVYASAYHIDGGMSCEVMSKEDIEDFKKAATAGKKASSWNGDFESEMWKKTALKRLSKRLPMEAKAVATPSHSVVHSKADVLAHDVEAPAEIEEATNDKK